MVDVTFSISTKEINRWMKELEVATDTFQELLLDDVADAWLTRSIDLVQKNSTDRGGLARSGVVIQGAIPSSREIGFSAPPCSIYRVWDKAPSSPSATIDRLGT